jgi:hypothetical protein
MPSVIKHTLDVIARDLALSCTGDGPPTYQELLAWSKQLRAVSDSIRRAESREYWDKKGRYTGKNAPLSANNPPAREQDHVS